MKALVLAALEEIRPYIQADGGDVELVSAENGIVTLRMTGHCVGCPSSQITLRQGIETHLRKRIPDMKELVQADSNTPSAPAHAPITSPFASGAPAPAPTPPPADTITANLRATHRKAESLLANLEVAVEAISAGKSKPEHLETLDAVDSFLRNDLATHMRQEDEVLFPALVPFITWGSPMSVMAKEHRILHDEIEALQQALSAHRAGNGNPQELARLGKRLSQRLRDDFYQEENVLFVEADDSLVGSRAKALREAMDRIAAAATREEA